MAEESKNKSSKLAVAYMLGFYPPLVRTFKNYTCSPVPKDDEDAFRLDREGRDVELKDYFSFRQKSVDLAAASQAPDKLKKLFRYNPNFADKIADAECDSNNILGMIEHEAFVERESETKSLIDLENEEKRNKISQSVKAKLDYEDDNQVGLEQASKRNDLNSRRKTRNKSAFSQVIERKRKQKQE